MLCHFLPIFFFLVFFLIKDNGHLLCVVHIIDLSDCFLLKSRFISSISSKLEVRSRCLIRFRWNIFSKNALYVVLCTWCLYHIWRHKISDFFLSFNSSADVRPEQIHYLYQYHAHRLCYIFVGSIGQKVSNRIWFYCVCQQSSEMGLRKVCLYMNEYACAAFIYIRF